MTGAVPQDPAPGSPAPGSPERPRVALVGVGAMGGAVLAGLLRAGWPPGHVVAVERSRQRTEAATARNGVVAGDLAAAATCDVVVVAVKPHDVPGVLDALPAVPAGGAAPVVVSLAAGLPTSVLEHHLPAGTPVVRVMPNTPATVGAGVSALSPGAHATDDHVALAERVMSAVGATVRVPETAQDAVTAVSGSGPAYVFYVVDAMAEAGVRLGLDRRTARDLAARTVLGAARMLVETGRHPVELREEVSSPAGTTIEALGVLDDRAVRAAVVAAMTAARDRAREIGERYAPPGG